MDAPPEGWNRATGDRITAAPVPDFLTPKLLVKNYGTVKKIVRQTLSETEGVHLRIGCFLGNVVWRALEKGRPYGVEVVADPYDHGGCPVIDPDRRGGRTGMTGDVGERLLNDPIRGGLNLGC